MFYNRKLYLSKHYKHKGTMTFGNNGFFSIRL